MNGTKPDRDPIDRLVRRYLRSEQERVDGDAFLQRLKERRRARRRVRLAPVALAGAAAVMLALSAALILWRPAVPTAPPEPPAAEAPPLRHYGEAARAELRAALEGARGVGSATISAGRGPLEELSLARPSMPALTASAESALRRLILLDETHQQPEENGP